MVNLPDVIISLVRSMTISEGNIYMYISMEVYIYTVIYKGDNFWEKIRGKK